MRYRNLLLPVCLLFSSFAFTQQGSRVYAITNDNMASPNGQLWMNISEVDLTTGQLIRPLFQRGKTSYVLYDGITKTKIPEAPLVRGGRSNASQSHTTKTMVAAAAFDRKHNRLYMIPMQVPELRWIDLDDNNASLKVYSVKFDFLTAEQMNDVANNITRLVIASDGYGYALTNDGNHLIRFSTGRKQTITDLGPLHDDGESNGISVHNRCTSWGGDMVADAAGNLYLVSASQTVFKINVPNKTAVYAGSIKGLPANYTTNGAAIDAEGKMIVSSANSSEGYYTVDMTNWSAARSSGKGQSITTSDLASGNFAFAKQAEQVKVMDRLQSIAKNNITVYPNPVTEGVLRISFDRHEKGRYQVQVLDLSGRIAMQQTIVTGTEKQIAEMDISEKLSKGLYMVKVLGADGKSLMTDKILVQ